MCIRKTNYILLAVLAVSLIASFHLHAYAGNTGGKHIRMMAQILKKAGNPLSEAQIEQINSIEKGPEAREQVQAVLTTAQSEALENTHKGTIGRRGGHGRMIARILDKAGVPLDDAQIEQIKAIKPGPEAREQVQAVLTTAQSEALENAHKGAIGRRGGHGRMMARALDKAGVPLDDTQIEQIKAIERGPEAREQIHAILTAEQKAVLENRFKRDIDEDGDALPERTDDLQKPTAVEEKPEAINLLKQNYPNPFNPTTTIDFHLTKSGNVKLEIFGPNGQRLTTLVNGYRNAGQHTVNWDASRYAGGVYVCKITAGNFTESRKMMYVK